MNSPRLLLVVAAVAAVSLLTGGWYLAGSAAQPQSVVDTAVDSPSVQEAVAEPTVQPTTVATETAPIDLSVVKPNEVGLVPIIEYHIIGDENGRWERSRESFRRDLQRLYDAGFRTISLHDFIDGKIDVPAGTSPLIITFDDSSPGQFTLIKDGDTLKPDPNCAIGIMEAFAQEHPDFGMHATFFVLPAADPPHNLFGQDEYQQAKLQYLVQHRMDIGNHTYWHQLLVDLPDDEVLEQIGMANKIITDFVPGYAVRTMALPLGEWSPNRLLVISGQWEDVAYSHDAVLLAGSDPTPSPFDVEYDRYAIPRVQVLDETMDMWFNGPLASGSDRRYISDGNPDTVTVPADLVSRVNTAALNGKQLIQY